MTRSDGARSMLSTARSALRSVANPDPVVQLTGEGGLLDFIPRISPHFQAPTHLRPLITALERAQREPVKIVCHAPPRHGKTISVLHAIVWSLVLNPGRIHAYVTYGASLSYAMSRECRALARAAGVEFARDAQGVKEWRTRQGGGLLATGIGGPLTGRGVSGMLLVDDPYKNRIEAESAARRELVRDWWRDVARTRLEPGASAIVFSTRWHPDDLSGFLIKEGWTYIRLPAVADHGPYTDALDIRPMGAPLWSLRFDAAALADLKREVGEYTWSSLFQGLPRGRGSSVFKTTPQRYTPQMLADVMKDPRGFRRGIGADFAYTKKTSADYSALIAGLGFVLDRKRWIYVREAKRMQEEPPKVAVFGQKMQERNGRCPALAYVSTTERGVAQLMAGYGFKCEGMLARGDKFTRAQPYAASWNDGRVLLPDEAPEDPNRPGRPDNWFTDWCDVFLAEHAAFTGNDDPEDDQVDAGAALHDLLARQPLGGAAAPPPIRTRSIDSASPLG